MLSQFQPLVRLAPLVHGGYLQLGKRDLPLSVSPQNGPEKKSSYATYFPPRSSPRHSSYGSHHRPRSLNFPIYSTDCAGWNFGGPPHHLSIHYHFYETCPSACFSSPPLTFFNTIQDCLILSTPLDGKHKPTLLPDNLNCGCPCLLVSAPFHLYGVAV